MRSTLVAAIVLAALTGCASAPSTRSLVVGAAHRVSEFRFDDAPPMSAALEFAPWAAVTARNAAERDSLEACIADRDACESGHLLRYRRLLELAADLEPDAQLRLAQEYFNSVDQKRQPGSTDDWASLYRVASRHAGDCKAIALGKYFTLRRLGWPAAKLRLVMNWDDRESDWHAVLAVHDADETYMLDSILGLQSPSAFDYGYMVYSISETGIWDHAPDFAPVP